MHLEQVDWTVRHTYVEVTQVFIDRWCVTLAYLVISFENFAAFTLTVHLLQHNAVWPLDQLLEWCVFDTPISLSDFVFLYWRKLVDVTKSTKATATRKSSQ